MTFKTEKLILVKITIKKKIDSSTRDIWVSEKSYASDYLYPSSPEVVGILESINGFGATIGRALTLINDGSISLKSVRGSLDYNKRIHDLLDEYSFIDQPIVGYSFQKVREVQSANDDDLEQEFDGVITDYKINVGNQTFEIDVQSNNISTNIVNKRYDIDDIDLSVYPVVDGLNAIAETLTSNTEGYSPIAFGDEVSYRPIPLLNIKQKNYFGNYTSIATIYSELSKYGTFEGGTFNPSIYVFFTQTSEIGIQKCDQFTSGNLPWGTGSDNNLDCKNSTQDRNYYFPIQTEADRIDFFNVNAFFRLIHSIRVGIIYNTTTPIGTMNLKLVYLDYNLSSNSISYIDIPNALAQIDKRTHYENEPIVLNLRFDFERPVLLDLRRQIYAEVYQTGDTPSAPGHFLVVFPSGDDITFYPDLAQKPVFYTPRQVTGTNNTASVNTSISGINPKNSLLGVYEVAYLNTANNFYVSLELGEDPEKIKITRENCKPDNFLFTARGIIEDFPSITGSTASLPIKIPYYIMRFLYYLQNNNSLTGWASGNTYYERTDDNTFELSGVEERGIGFRQLMIDILEASNSVLIKKRNGQYIMWTYDTEWRVGESSEPIACIISERDCNLLSIQSLGIQNIVNKARLEYDHSYIPLQASVASDSVYRKKLEKSDAESIAIYGERELPITFQTNKWIKSDETANRYLDYKLEQMSSERFKITIEVPFWGSVYGGQTYWQTRIFYYKDLELWQLVNFNHIDMPSKSGTEPPNKAFTFQGGDDWAMGDVIRNAKSYICRVISKQPIFDLNSEPTLRIELLTLGENEKY